MISILLLNFLLKRLSIAAAHNSSQTGECETSSNLNPQNPFLGFVQKLKYFIYYINEYDPQMAANIIVTK